MALTSFVVASMPARADTSGFRGMNWARLGDNFTTGALVIDGLSQSDSYSTVRAKANSLYDDMQSSMGVNTVRLPINTATVGTTWWNNYRGAIDAATDRGFKVILAYWEDGAASNGRVTNTSAFNSMWNTVVSEYGSNSRVYFEPMNEPHGYSSTDWLNFAATWMADHSSVPRDRILIGGTGFSQDLRPACNDSRFSGTLLAIHYYAFWYGYTDYSSWRNTFETLLGNCASRAVVTEFGAAMDNGLDYSSTTTSNNFVTYLRGITGSMHDLHIGGTYWPAAGGKNSGSGHDGYSMFALSGSGTNLHMAVRNSSGANRVRFGWGDATDSGGGGSSTGTYARLQNRATGLYLDGMGRTSIGSDVGQYSSGGSANQQWTVATSGGYVTIQNRATGLYIDAMGRTSIGSAAAQWSGSGSSNQQWVIVNSSPTNAR